MNYKWLPNLLTLTRIFLVPVFLYYLFSNFIHSKLVAAIIFTIASITDAYDGKIARKHNLISKFGTFFDPLADKFLVLSAFYSFMFFPILYSIVNLWMIVLISFRDVLVTLLRIFMQYKGITMITSKLGKIKTILQLMTIQLILIYLIIESYNYNILSALNFQDFLYFLMVITTLITFYTGMHYFYYNYRNIINLFLKK